MKEYKASGYIVYLLVNTILLITLHLQRRLEDQQVAPPTIFISSAKSPLTKVYVLLAPFLCPDKHNKCATVQQKYPALQFSV